MKDVRHGPPAYGVRGWTSQGGLHRRHGRHAQGKQEVEEGRWQV